MILWTVAQRPCPGWRPQVTPNWCSFAKVGPCGALWSRLAGPWRGAGVFRPTAGGEGLLSPPPQGPAKRNHCAAAHTARPWQKSTNWASLAAAVRGTPAAPPSRLLHALPCRWRRLRWTWPQYIYSGDDKPIQGGRPAAARLCRHLFTGFRAFSQRRGDRLYGHVIVRGVGGGPARRASRSPRWTGNVGRTGNWMGGESGLSRPALSTEKPGERGGYDRAAGATTICHMERETAPCTP